MHITTHQPNGVAQVPLALVGSSAAVSRARASLETAIQTQAPVLILADDGLEPASVARILHERTRLGSPFVTIDCAGADGAAVEQELFGRSDRAPAGTDLEPIATGAALMRAGGGTLLLLNIGDLPAGAQRRLGRVLRDGEARSRRGLVRLRSRIVATSRPAIAADLRDGAFRNDLFRRLSQQTIEIPPLNARPGDISEIIDVAATLAAAEIGRPKPAITQAALTVLSALPWVRNVEELRAVIERIVRSVADGVIRQEEVLASLPIEGAIARRTPHVSLREARQRFEREYIATVLEHHRWRMSEAARTLGIERANLYRKTRQLGIVRAARTER